MLKIGFGQADITPRGGKLSLRGQFEERITDNIHDPLQAVAMAVVSENARSIYVGIDLLQIFKQNSEYIFEEVKKAVPDLKENELCISATHIHTGPDLLIDTYLSITADRSEPKSALTCAECLKQVAAGIAKAVREALDSLEEARAEIAIARIQTGVNRRITYKDNTGAMYGNPHLKNFYEQESRDGGPSQFLYVYKAATDELMGIVANVPCTAQCDEYAMYVTADYWGVVRGEIEEKLGKNVKLLPLCRAAGDLSPHNLVDGEAVEQKPVDLYHGRNCALWLGGWIAENIIEFKDKTLQKYEGNVEHAQAMHKVDFPVWQVTEAEYKWAKAYFADKKNFDADGKPLSKFDNANADTRIRRYESGDKTYECKIFGMRLGNIVLLTMPFEVYIEYADRIRMSHPELIFMDVQLAYDSMGYLATPPAVEHGHYSANIFNGVCSPEGGEKLVAEEIALAEELIK